MYFFSYCPAVLTFFGVGVVVRNILLLSFWLRNPTFAQTLLSPPSNWNFHEQFPQLPFP